MFTNVFINLTALQDNYHNICKAIGETYCVIKSDAYGHGAMECAAALYECGARKFVVSDIKEALNVRPVLGDSDILVLGFTPREYTHLLVEHNFTQSVFSLEQMREYSYTGTEIRVHAKINSGMNRLGFSCDEQGISAVKELQRQKNINLCGIFTHYASAAEPNGDFTLTQCEKFNDFSRQFGGNLLRHSANSAAALRYPQTRMDISRVGLILYGHYPCQTCPTLPLTPVMQLKSYVISLMLVKKGDPIGYGCDEICTRDTLIATLPIGYANGLLRGYKNHVNPCIRGKNAKIIGRICMDKCMIDVTNSAENGTIIKVGDEVEFFCSNVEFSDFSAKVKTINYEVVTTLGKLNNKIYIK